MTPPRLLSIVVPSYNDAPIIRSFHSAIVAEMEKQDRWRWELVYVDDGSIDESPEILAELARADSRVGALLLLHNFGQQRALFAGLEHARGDVVVIIDGDYQYEPSAILAMADALAPDVDMVSGIRVDRRDPGRDRFFSAIGNWLLGRILDSRLTDYGSTKAFSRALVGRILAMRHHFSDVLPAALSTRPRVAETAVPHRPRPSGRSHWNVWMRAMLLLDTYVLYGHQRMNSGIKFGALLALSAPAVALTGIAAGWPWYAWLGASVYLGSAAAALVAWALVMRLVMRLYRQNVSRDPYIVRERIGVGAPGDRA